VIFVAKGAAFDGRPIRRHVAGNGAWAGCLLLGSYWHRLLDGVLFATSSYVDWAALLHRTFGFDSLRCPKRDHRMRILSTITDPVVAKKILDHLGVRTDPLPRAPARDPTGQTDFDFDAA
jgi:hypothetical protein